MAISGERQGGDRSGGKIRQGLIGRWLAKPVAVLHRNVPSRQLLLRCCITDMVQASLSSAARSHRLPVGDPEGEGV